MRSMRLSTPIPGQSLTAEPKNAPYENPPEIVDPEEALQVHLTRLNEPKRMQAAMDFLEIGVDIQTLTEGILRNAVMNGIHSVDASLVIAPVIHEYIKLTAEELDIDYKEGFEEDEESEKKRMYEIASVRAKKTLEKMDMLPEDTVEEDEEVEEPMIEEEMTQEKPKGLMSRGDM